MYLAPLNYDRYFKKVFSDIRIAKRFLEDFFDVEIQELQILPNKHKITDDASAVEFDFRCRIKDSFVIIDMQQWFKSDIVKRFYMYHSMNTVLQLERMPDKSIDLEDNKKRDIKDYDKLIPVITLIWLADDNLNFKEDFVSYTMTSEVVHDFLRNRNLWKEDNILELIAERGRCLEIINNKTKKLDFLQKNKLIYAFQTNIVKNRKFSKYLPWFELADKTRNKLNEKGWFDEYLKDDIFAEIIRRINTASFEQADWEYINDYEKFTEQVKRFESVFLEQGIEMGIDQGKNREKVDAALKGIAAGFSNDIIRIITGLSDEQIDELRK
jgi:hypothetical protein